jgi:hypothetical protein
MMKELRDVLKPKGRYLSTAVIAAGSGTGQHIHKEVFEYIDFLNIMSYDAGGATHSSYELAVSSFDYWVKDRACPKEKAILGVPFYGRSPYTDYKVILQQDPAAASKDKVGAIAYNGIATMKRKTELALQRGGGVMIWEITQDVTGPNSLLATIHNTIQSTPTVLRAAATGSLAVPEASIAAGVIRYSGIGKGPYTLSIHSAAGRRIHAERFFAAAASGSLAWNGANDPTGVYTLSISPDAANATAVASGDAAGSITTRFLHLAP